MGRRGRLRQAVLGIHRQGIERPRAVEIGLLGRDPGHALSHREGPLVGQMKIALCKAGDLLVLHRLQRVENFLARGIQQQRGLMLIIALDTMIVEHPDDPGEEGIPIDGREPHLLGDRVDRRAREQGRDIRQ